jgi:hypothetical protein
VQVEQDAGVGEIGRIAEDFACEAAERGVGGMRGRVDPWPRLWASSRTLKVEG